MLVLASGFTEFAVINPWATVWFQPQKTALWAKNNYPLYGVLVLLALHVLVTLLAPIVGAAVAPPTESALDPMPASHRFGLAIDIWIMPVVLVFVLYAVGKYLNGSATLKNILWVMLWSQIPIMLLSVLTVLLQAFGWQTADPLLKNEMSFVNGQMVLEPPIPEINTHAFAYFIISTVPLLWSFQILLSGMAAVQGVTVKRAMWFLTLAVILLMLIRLPIG